MTNKPILSNEDRLEMLKFYQTITVDGNGKAVKMKYDEHIVRHDTLRLLADTEHFLTIIESQSRTIGTYEEVHNGWLERFRNYEEEAKSQKTEISSLITTIESQKEEIEALHDALEMLPTKDIEIHERTGIKINETVSRLLIDASQKEIESLKAITELAVKGLKLELESAKIWDKQGTIAHIESVLSKIERLQNEQI